MLRLFHSAQLTNPTVELINELLWPNVAWSVFNSIVNSTLDCFMQNPEPIKQRIRRIRRNRQCHVLRVFHQEFTAGHHLPTPSSGGQFVGSGRSQHHVDGDHRWGGAWRSTAQLDGFFGDVTWPVDRLVSANGRAAERRRHRLLRVRAGNGRRDGQDVEPHAGQPTHRVQSRRIPADPFEAQHQFRRLRPGT